MAATRATTRSKRRIGYGIVLALLLYGFFEAGCFVTLQLLDRIHGVRYERLPVDDLLPLQRYVLSLLVEGQHEHLVHDAELGWTIRPNGGTALYAANGQGLRASKEFAADPPDGCTRIATFGDSFTHGDDVADDETWQAQLERLDPRLEILNFGVPSYGPAQSFLRYEREGTRFHPHVVVIGFLSENLYRSVNVFRPFYRPPTGVPLSKPRFVLDGEDLVLLRNPLDAIEHYRELLDEPVATLHRLGRNDYYYQLLQRRSRADFLPSVRLLGVVRTRFLADEIVKDGRYDPQTEAFRLTLRILERFAQRVAEEGARPIVLVYPTATDLRHAREGRPRVYEPMLGALEERGVPYLDLLNAFEELGADVAARELIRLHNTPLGNRLIARYLHAHSALLLGADASAADVGARAAAEEAPRVPPGAGRKVSGCGDSHTAGSNGREIRPGGA